MIFSLLLLPKLIIFYKQIIERQTDMNELERWQRIAGQNFSDNQFFIWLNANKAFNLFQNSALPLSMDSYRAQAAIANALLIHYLDLSDNKILNTKKVAFLLIHFDNLVQKAIVLDNTPGVQQLNTLVKCLLYMRIGDFIVGISLTENKLNSTRIQKQKVLALYSYSLAYEWAHQGWEEGFCDSHQLDPLLALCFAELHVLLQNNLRNKTDRMSQALQNCNKQSLHNFIASFTQTYLPTRTAISRDSLIENDQIEPSGNFYDVNLQKLITASWFLCKNVHFLRRLVWLMRNSAAFEESNYDFLEEQFYFLPACPLDPDDACAPEGLSLTDVKLFLFRLSHHVNSNFEDEGFTPPWPFYQKPTPNQQFFWESLHEFNTNQHQSKEDLQSLLNMTRALEQIRSPDIESIDPKILREMATFIKHLCNTSTNVEVRNYYKHLLRRYLDILKSTVQEDDWVLVVEDYEDTSADESEKQTPTCGEDDGKEPEAAAPDIKEAIPAEPSQSEVCFESISTQTDEPEQQTEHNEAQHNPLHDWAIMQDWGEVNFHIQRWKMHNLLLRRLF